MIAPTCDWHPEHDIARDKPTGERCGKPATHRIVWQDGSQRFSLACDAHLDLDEAAPPHTVEPLSKETPCPRP